MLIHELSHNKLFLFQEVDPLLDPEKHGDGWSDDGDDFIYDSTQWSDTDGDGYGDNPDGYQPDEYPDDANEWADTDGDGMPDDLNGNSSTGLVPDWDDDGDGYNDTDDAFPLDLNEWVDTDGDGIGNNADTDDDNDGWLDNTEIICGTSDPLNASSMPDDFDGDGVCDLLDYDDDNDSYIDAMDAFQFDPCAAVDTDGDGMPNWIFLNCNTTLIEDTDDDNDGYLDDIDIFPEDSTEWSDNDMDGIGDNADLDDDNDLVPDTFDEFPFDASEWNDNDDDGKGKGDAPKGPPDVVYGASFYTMLEPHVRLVYREGDFAVGSFFYPTLGCAAPPQGFSVMAVSGTPIKATCAISEVSQETVEVPLQATETVAEVACKNQQFYLMSSGIHEYLSARSGRRPRGEYIIHQ